MQRVGIYGGSFDPVHCGHMILALDAVEQLRLARLHLVPAAANPFKRDATMTDGAHRIAMLRLAAAGSPRLLVDDRELRRGGVSYAVDTARELRADYPQAELILLIGEDNATGLESWHRFDELRGLVRFAAFPRADAPGPPDTGGVELVGRQVDISSTEIRARVRERRSVRYLLPEAVHDYIESHRLYLAPDD